MSSVLRARATVGALVLFLATLAGLGIAGTDSGIMIAAIAVVAAVAIVLGIMAIVLIGRTIGGQVRSAMSSIGTSVTGLLAVASQVAAATSQTAAATNETTATVEEVKQTTLLAQEKAAESLELSQKVLTGFQHHAERASDNHSKFEEIRVDMDVVTDAIARLNEQAGSVRDIIATVNDLAEQSNLLSVNASIEAAKAGDAGKGFTVVAQEVKSLAAQSKQAVSQVSSVLGDIERASSVAVASTERAYQAVESGRVSAGLGADAAKSNLAVATESTEAALQIAATSRQQLAGMEQISSAIASINQAGDQQADGAREVQSQARQLQELTLSLRALVDASGNGSSGRPE